MTSVAGGYDRIRVPELALEARDETAQEEVQPPDPLPAKTLATLTSTPTTCTMPAN